MAEGWLVGCDWGTAGWMWLRDGRLDVAEGWLVGCGWGVAGWM